MHARETCSNYQFNAQVSGYVGESYSFKDNCLFSYFFRNEQNVHSYYYLQRFQKLIHLHLHPSYCRCLERTFWRHFFGSKFGNVQTEHCHHRSCNALGLLIAVSLQLLSFTVTNCFIFIFIFSFPP